MRSGVFEILAVQMFFTNPVWFETFAVAHKTVILIDFTKLLVYYFAKPEIFLCVLNEFCAST